MKKNLRAVIFFNGFDPLPTRALSTSEMSSETVKLAKGENCMLGMSWMSVVHPITGALGGTGRMGTHHRLRAQPIGRAALLSLALVPGCGFFQRHVPENPSTAESQAGEQASMSDSSDVARREENAPARPSEFTGTVTFENRTSIPICRIETQDEGIESEYGDYRVEIAPGESGNFSVSGTLKNVWVVGCDGRFLTDRRTAYTGRLNAGTITLHEPSAVPTEPERLALAAAPISQAEFLDSLLESLITGSSGALNQRALRTSLFRALPTGANAVHEPTAVRVVSSEWNVVRNEITGVILRRSALGVGFFQYMGGRCEVTTINFSQAHDGRRYSDSVSIDRMNPYFPVPCTVADFANSHRDWAH
jgi:hypothetical protein